MVIINRMQRDFLNLLMKFYETVVEKQRHGLLLSRSLERLLSYEVQEEEKRSGRESSGSGRSGGSRESPFQQIQKLFCSGQLETALLFQYLLNALKNPLATTLHSFFALLSDRLKKHERLLAPDDHRRLSLRLSKLYEQMQFLEVKAVRGTSVDWLALEAFKEFEPDSLLAAQLLAVEEPGRDAPRGSDIEILLRLLEAKCWVFDFNKKEGRSVGSGAQELFLGKRSEGFFLLTQQEYQQAALGQTVAKKAVKETGSEVKELKKYSTNKCKEQFLA